MLVELHIEDFAIIDRLDLDFGAGLVTFTGETGAGKSIIIDAVGTLLGSRADTTMVRAGAERALVEGVFRLEGAAREHIEPLLQEEDLIDDPEYLVLGREIRNQGRSIARVNGRSVNLKLIREIGEFLVDIHGQTEHLSLLRVRHHLQLLDRFASVEAELEAYGREYRQLMATRKELAALRKAEKDAARRIDLLNYQIEEIEAARLDPEEETDLRGERARLANAESLTTLVQEALAALEEGDGESPTAADLLGQAFEAAAGLAKLDPSQAELREQAQAMVDGLGELSRVLRDYLEGIEYNPRRLSWVEDRLDTIYNLKRKYGESIEAVLAFAVNAKQELDTITHAEERIAELEAIERQALLEAATHGQALSGARKAAAQKLASAVEKELVDLRMDQARFEVDFQVREDPDGLLLEDTRRVAFDATGLDQVEFLVAPNPGEGLKPLVKIASGGETSRLMLALKNVLARADQTPTLIFDEIDQGIGGRVGATVGQKLWSLARAHQVLCITHLPQLAAYGDQHYRVLKTLFDGRTVTQVEHLAEEKRLEELAQMLGEISDGTRQSAQELFQAAKTKTSAAK